MKARLIQFETKTKKRQKVLMLKSSDLMLVLLLQSTIYRELAQFVVYGIRDENQWHETICQGQKFVVSYKR